MRDFHKWIIEEGFWDGIGNAMRKGADFLSPPAAAPVPPTPTPTPAPTPPKPNLNDDPAVQDQKYNEFLNLLMTKFRKDIHDIDTNETIKEHLANIAEAYVKGHHIYSRYINELLIAIHQDENVAPLKKTSTFNNHIELWNYIQEIYRSKPTLWYNPAEKYSMHPEASKDSKEIISKAHGWSRSPHRYKEPKVAKPQKTIWSSDAAKLLYEKLLEDHVQVQTKIPLPGQPKVPKYIRKKLEMMHVVQMAKMLGININPNSSDCEVTEEDIDLMFTKINV